MNNHTYITQLRPGAKCHKTMIVICIISISNKQFHCLDQIININTNDNKAINKAIVVLPDNNKSEIEENLKREFYI